MRSFYIYKYKYIFERCIEGEGERGAWRGRLLFLGGVWARSEVGNVLCHELVGEGRQWRAEDAISFSTCKIAADKLETFLLFIKFLIQWAEEMREGVG